MAENGDLCRHSDTAPKKNLKEGEIDVRELQQKRHMAEVKRFIYCNNDNNFHNSL